MQKTRQEILQQLLEWQEQGKIGTKYTWVENGEKLTAGSVDLRVRKGLIMRTPIRALVCTPDIWSEFSTLCQEGRVMDCLGAKTQFKLLNDFAVTKYCAEGNLLKSTMFGVRTGIYISPSEEELKLMKKQ